jgi:hypothetical protein
MIQVETSTTVKLRRVFLRGFANYLPFTSYDSSMFMLKRLTGVPGYQYKVKNEFLQPQIFTAEEILKISTEYETRIGHEYRKYLTFYDKFLLFDTGVESMVEVAQKFDKSSETSQKVQKHFDKVFGNESTSNINICVVDESSIVYDDRNYYKLSFRDKIFVNMYILMHELLKYSFPRKLFGISWIFLRYRMDRRLKLAKSESSCLNE